MTDAPFASRHTNTLAGLLADLGVALAVSTYQAGKLIIVRSDGQRVNTHFRDFHHPTGLAAGPGVLAVATRTGVWQYRDQPALGPKFEPAGTHDAAYLPRTFHATGDIAVHELGFAGGDLWAVNTRFSCLSSFDGLHSFVPRWRPPFITDLLPQDRCHMNGLAVADERVRFVTCHGATNTEAGWRPGKAAGGVILEVPSGRVLRAGLSMPHSPRMFNGQLWVCDSGHGAISALNPVTGEPIRVGLLPGFTRGLDFAGPVAFVGLSQVRESMMFGGLPLSDRVPVDDRKCGVWAIDTGSGDVLGFLEFTSGVREVFAVTVLPHRWPELLTDPAAEPCLWSYLLPP